MITAAQYQGKPWAPRNGLIGWWPLDEGTGTTSADRGSGGHTADCSASGFSWGTGKYRGCAVLDGSASNGYVILGSALIPTTATDPWTVSLWFKTSENTDRPLISQYVYTDGGRWLVDLNETAGKVRIFHGGSAGSIRSTASYVSGAWNVVAVTRLSATFYLYLNGAYQTSGYGSLGINNTNTLIGRAVGSGLSCFNGSVEDVRIYNRVLSAAEIAEMYNRSK